eukprot:13947670-Alexandrium_andersonii.AAC.1
MPHAWAPQHPWATHTGVSRPCWHALAREGVPSIARQWSSNPTWCLRRHPDGPACLGLNIGHVGGDGYCDGSGEGGDGKGDGGSGGGNGDGDGDADSDDMLMLRIA